MRERESEIVPVSARVRECVCECESESERDETLASLQTHSRFFLAVFFDFSMSDNDSVREQI